MAPRARPPIGYERRRPEETVLYEVLAEHLETFLARTDEASTGRGLPGFVKRELRGFLRCGVLAYGFGRLWCPECGDDLLVGFSCRGRGFCPSCLGRRMVDTAAHLVDRLVPVVPVRHWVLSFPYPLRYRLAYDAELLTAVLGIWFRAVSGHYRRKAKRLGLDVATCTRCGSKRRLIAFIQRPAAARQILAHLGLPHQPPPIAPARAPPQHEMDLLSLP